MSSSTLYTSDTCALPGAEFGEMSTRSAGVEDGEHGEFDPDERPFLSLKEVVPFTVADSVAAGDDR
jgi:hypothetical protein